jgi:hypothetical protein
MLLPIIFKDMFSKVQKQFICVTSQHMLTTHLVQDQFNC